MLFSRGVALAPVGSVQDRVMREMVFRERQEKVGQVEALTHVVARIFGGDPEKLFGDIVSDYAFEVFQETYDADLLRQKAAALHKARETLRAKKNRERGLMERMERMGEFYDQKLGKDIRNQSGSKPKKEPLQPAASPRKVPPKKRK